MSAPRPSNLLLITIGLSVAFAMAIGGLFGLGKVTGFSIDPVTTNVLIQASTDQPIPPSFHGNRWAFGFQLWGLLSIAFLSGREMVIVATPIWRYRDAFGSLVTMNRLVELGYLAIIEIGVLPDVLVLIFWNEVSFVPDLLLLDKICDGMLILLFVIILDMKRRYRRKVDFMLLGHTVEETVTDQQHRRNHKAIVVLVMLASLGVALGK